MQLWLVTRRGFTEEGEDPVNNPVDNIRVGARFLKHLYDRYHERFEGVGTMKWLYGAYNLGEPEFDSEYRQYGTNIGKYKSHEGKDKWKGFQRKLKRWEKEYNRYKRIFR